MPIFLTLGTRGAGIEGYLEQLRILMRWMQRYPDTVCSLTHGFPWRALWNGRQFMLPDAIWEPFKNRNCSLEVCLPVRLGDLFDFPYRECHPVMQAMLERIGARQLLWGTDMPFQNRFCTCHQSRLWIERYCTFIRAQDLKWLMGGTAARILQIPTTNEFT